MKKWTFWFKKVNADMISDIEAEDYDTAAMYAREVWKSSNPPEVKDFKSEKIGVQR